MMLKFVLVEVSHTASTTHSSCNRTLNILSMALPSESGRGLMRSEQRLFAIYDERPSQIIVISPMRPTGFRTA